MTLNYKVTLTDGQVMENVKGPLTISKTLYKFAEHKFERTSVALIEDAGGESDEESEGEQ